MTYGEVLRLGLLGIACLFAESFCMNNCLNDLGSCLRPGEVYFTLFAVPLVPTAIESASAPHWLTLPAATGNNSGMLRCSMSSSHWLDS